VPRPVAVPFGPFPDVVRADIGGRVLLVIHQWTGLPLQASLAIGRKTYGRAFTACGCGLGKGMARMDPGRGGPNG